MKILTRYVLKEHVGPLMFALCALTSLLLLNYIAKQLSTLVGKGLPWNVIAEFLALSIPFTVAMTLPMAILVATLYAFSRLSSENEVSAMKANGVSMGSLLFPISIGAVILALVMVAFNDQLLPRANHRLKTLQNDIAKKKPTFALKEGILNPIPNRGLTLRADKIDRGANLLRNVHIYDIMQPDAVRDIFADSATIALTTDQRDLVLTLYDGYVVDVDRKEPGSLNRVYFTMNRLRIKDIGNELTRVQQDDFKGEREQSVCEMTEKYDEAYRQYEAGRLELKANMLHLVREAVRGGQTMYASSAEPPAVPPDKTWGSIYCSGVKKLATWIPALKPLAPIDTGVSSDSTDVDSSGVVKSGVEPAAATVSVPDEVTSQIIDSSQIGRTFQFQSMSHFTESIGSGLGTSANLIAMQQRVMNRFQVEIHKKFSLAGACIVFVLIGVPFALRFPRGGVGFVIGTSLVIFAISYVGLIAGEALADRSAVSPFLAMWGANFLLAIVGILLILRMGRESMTRGSAFAGLFDAVRYRFSKNR